MGVQISHMVKHYGQTVEYVVRKNGYSITDLARGLGVNRRTVYNYFRNKYLKHVVIHQIGLLLRHDFSKEFPEFFTSDQFEPDLRSQAVKAYSSNPVPNDEHWKDKYIQLLEQYKHLITAIGPVEQKKDIGHSSTSILHQSA